MYSSSCGGRFEVNVRDCEKSSVSFAASFALTVWEVTVSSSVSFITAYSHSGFSASPINSVLIIFIEDFHAMLESLNISE